MMLSSSATWMDYCLQQKR